MTRYTFDVDLPSDVPADVVAEYVGAALKRYVTDRVSVKVRASGGTLTGPTQPFRGYAAAQPGGFTPVNEGRAHPFADGSPEVFDDDITVDTFAEPVTFEELVHGEASFPIQGDYPHLTALLGAKRDSTTITDGEGDWQLDPKEGDSVGSD